MFNNIIINVHKKNISEHKNIHISFNSLGGIIFKK